MDIEYRAGNSYIDIVLLIDKLVIAIENKIKENSATETQLKEQYAGLKEKFKDGDRQIFMVFLVPTNFGSQKIKDEYESLSVEAGDCKCLLEWSEVVNIIDELLDDERKGNITPIYEYMRHTLKSFSNFIQDDFVGYPFETIRKSSGQNPLTVNAKTFKDIESDSTISWVGVQHGISGLLQYEKIDLENKRFQCAKESMENERQWLKKDLFVAICKGINSNNFDNIDWGKYVDRLSAAKIYRIAKNSNSELFIGIQGGVDALTDMSVDTIKGKSWAIDKERQGKTSNWISKDNFIEIVEGRKVFAEH
jgi:hypothetical protein